MKVAIIDIGSNSSRLNVFDVSSSSEYKIVDFHRFPTALAGYIDSTGFLSAQGVQLACESVGHLQLHASKQLIDVWQVFATASLRKAVNCQEVQDAIASETGLPVDVLSGEREAAFGFESLRRRFDIQDAVLADVGGGSTEVVVAQDGEIRASASLPLGCRTLSKKYVAGEDMDDTAIAMMRSEISEQLAACDFHFVPGCSFYGIGGTAKALHRMMGSTNPVLPLDLMVSAREVCPEREDTILAGALIYDELWKLSQPTSFLSSSANAREGYLIAEVLPKLSDISC